MIIVGLFLSIVPIILLIIQKKVIMKKTTEIIQDIFLILLSLLYIILCFIIKTEPFIFDIEDAFDYLTYTAVIIVFSPFLWLGIYYFSKKIFRSLRIFKNSKLKSNNEYIYYRDDLNKISPSIIMFTATMDTDVRKSVSATILKLKLTGYIIKKNGNLIVINKVDSKNELLESEKMVLELIKNNQFDESKYSKVVEQEALTYNYIKKNNSAKVFKLIKILIAIFIPIIIINYVIIFDKYVFENHSFFEYDGVKYLEIQDEKEIEKLYDEGKIKQEDYYYRILNVNGYDEKFYSYNKVRADKIEYGVIKKAYVFQILDILCILMIPISIIISIFYIIDQIVHFNKNYKRTAKGNQLINKAYALKNYLKDFSVIKNRKEAELVLWEYYLVYAIVLGVNVNIQDEIIDKYLKKI